MKGTSEIVVEYCDYFLDNNGENQKLTERYRQELTELSEYYSTKSYRTIMIAFKDLSQSEYDQLLRDNNGCKE